MVLGRKAERELERRGRIERHVKKWGERKGFIRGLVEREKEREGKEVKRIEGDFGFWLFVPFMNKLLKVNPYEL